MTREPLRYIAAAVSAAGLSLVSLTAAGVAAQTRPASNGASAAVPTPRTPDGTPDLSGRWGGGGAGGAGGVRAIEPNGRVHEFEHYSEYSAALAAGTVSRDAKIIGRQPNYRHGNNLYSERDAGFTQRAFGNPPLYKPEFWERVQRLDENGNKEDTTFSCFPHGVPRVREPEIVVSFPSTLQCQGITAVRVTAGPQHLPVVVLDVIGGDRIVRFAHAQAGDAVLPDA